MLISEFPLLPRPPEIPREMTERAVRDHFVAVRRWQEGVMSFLDIRERLTDDSVNGQIEWPTPFLTVGEPTGNIKAHYACLSIEFTGGTRDAILTIDHSLEAIPRFWWPVYHNPPSHTVSISDRVVSSDDSTPLVGPGNTGADVDAVDPLIIRGGSNGSRWLDNDVQPGDLLKLAGDPDWHRVKTLTSVGGATPDFVTLQTPTSLALGTTNVGYVFRRLGTKESIHVRVIADDPSLVVATLVIV